MKFRLRSIVIATVLSLLGVSLAAVPSSATAPDGSLDTTFNSNFLASFVNPNMGVRAMTVRPDGEILASTGMRIYQISPNGVSTGVEFPEVIDGIIKLAVDASNNIYVVGGFYGYSDWNGASTGLARLLPDGNIDPSFLVGTGFDNRARVIQILPDGKLLVGGEFANYDGQPVAQIVRLLPNGTLDSTYNPTFTGSAFVTAMAQVGGGKTLVAGSDGAGSAYIIRLNADGSTDQTFAQVTCTGGTGGASFVSTVEKAPNGKYLVAGDFYSCGGVSHSGVVMLNADGSVDSNFAAGTGVTGNVYQATVQADNKIIVAGNFSAAQSTTVNGIARFNPDGSVDQTFEINSAWPGFAAQQQGRVVAIQSSGKILVGGLITSYNGVSVGSLISLENTPPVAPVVTPPVVAPVATPPAVNTFPVTLDPNFGASPVTQTQYTEGGCVSLPAPAKRPQYAFSGWSTSPTGSVLPSGPYCPGSGAKTVYAQWSQTAVSVTLSTDDGAPSFKLEVPVGKCQSLPAPTSQSGRFFAGWANTATNERLANSEVCASAGPSLTFKATWSNRPSSASSKQLVVSGFAPGSAILTNAMKLKIKRAVSSAGKAQTASCLGVTQGPTVLKSDRQLAESRAVAACNFAKSAFKSINASRKLVTIVSGLQELTTGDSVRRVILIFN